MLREAHEQRLVLQESRILPRYGLVIRRKLPKGARLDGSWIHGIERLAAGEQREAALLRQRDQRAAAHHLVLQCAAAIQGLVERELELPHAQSRVEGEEAPMLAALGWVTAQRGRAAESQAPPAYFCVRCCRPTQLLCS